MKTLVLFLLVLVGEYVVSSYMRKIQEKKKLELIRIKSEIYAQRKREAFAEYRREVEEWKAKNEKLDTQEVEVDEESDNVINFAEGVQRLRDNGPKYVPYERPTNPLNDIRNSLSEFTVNDVLQTFYF